MKVRCAGCKGWKEKEFCVPFGLGYCCDENCRWTAVEKRRKRMSAQGQKIAERGYTIAPSPPRARAKQASPGKRRYIRERDGKRCRLCGTATNLHVHHIKYRSEGGTHDERNLITVCLSCHDRVHSNKRYWQPVLLETMRIHYDDELFLMIPEVARRLDGGLRPTA